GQQALHILRCILREHACHLRRAWERLLQHVRRIALCWPNRRRRRRHPTHFLRKRSSRTTSAPSPGFSASAGSLGGAGDGAGSADDAGSAGTFLGSEWGATSDGSNCSPNCTEGSKKLLMALKGTANRSGMPPNERPTSNLSSATSRSQNWCCRMIVISSGY